jgi:hypothetical protein
MTIYTLGYSGWKIEDVGAVLDRLDAILVDVRMVPRSRWAPAWNASALAARFGDRYLWLREFGNVNYKGTFEQIEIADFPTGISVLSNRTGQPFEGAKNIILLCGCRDVNVCHRKVLAERLAESWKAEVIHPACRGVARRLGEAGPTPPKPAPPVFGHARPPGERTWLTATAALSAGPRPERGGIGSVTHPEHNNDRDNDYQRVEHERCFGKERSQPGVPARVVR